MPGDGDREAEVQRWKQGRDQQYGGHHAAQHDGGHRRHDLQPRPAAQSDGRQGDRRQGDGSRQRRHQPIAGAALHQRHADRFLAAGLEILEVAEKQHPAADGQREHRQQPHPGTQRQLRSVDHGRRHAPDQCEREADEQQRRQPPALESGLHQQEHADQRGDHSAQHPALADLVSGRPLEHLGVVFQWEAGRGQAIPDIRCHGTEIPAAHARHHVDVPGDRIPADHARGLGDPHVGHLAEPDVAAARTVDQEVPHGIGVTSDGRGALHHDVEHLLLLEDAADQDALQQRRFGAPHVARLDRVLPCLRQIDVDLERRLQRRPDDGRIHDPVHLRNDPSHLLGLVVQHRLILAVHADRQRPVDPGQDVEAAGGVVLTVAQGADVAYPLIGVRDDVAADGVHPADDVRMSSSVAP